MTWSGAAAPHRDRRTPSPVVPRDDRLHRAAPGRRTPLAASGRRVPGSDRRPGWWFLAQRSDRRQRLDAGFEDGGGRHVDRGRRRGPASTTSCRPPTCTGSPQGWSSLPGCSTRCPPRDPGSALARYLDVSTLLVVGGPCHHRWILGGVAGDLVRRASSPILVVPVTARRGCCTIAARRLRRRGLAPRPLTADRLGADRRLPRWPVAGSHDDQEFAAQGHGPSGVVEGDGPGPPAEALDVRDAVDLAVVVDDVAGLQLVGVEHPHGGRLHRSTSDLVLMEPPRFRAPEHRWMTTLSRPG